MIKIRNSIISGNIKKLFLELIITVGLLVPFSVDAQQRDLQPPKLVVGIVVDQMRWDYLYRYYDKYGKNGFKRLLNEGFSANNVMINYLPSFTAVGHTTIFTGSVPSIDGITGNYWIDQRTRKKVYCTMDSTVQTVGSDSKAGEMSPRNLWVTTVTDELRLANNFHSRVVGISLKDRAAILPAGHTANAAFWFDNESGNFITSSYYMKRLPKWVKKFNEQNIPQKLIADGWNTLLPLKEYTESTPDNVPWEGHLVGKNQPVFPYQDLLEKYNKSHGIIRKTPFGNTLTLDFAKAAILGYQLGQRNVTDFLTINCASTDYVGHKFGSYSVEIEDTFLRLDKELAGFFKFLDQKIGIGNYLVFLTSDHGAISPVGFLKKHKLPTGFWNIDLFNRINTFLARKTGVHNLVTKKKYFRIVFNRSKITTNHLGIENIKHLTVGFLRHQKGILYSVDMNHIDRAPIPKRVKTMIINGYNRERSASIQIIPKAGWVPDYDKAGATHGTWNPYNAHIPLIFMGWHITHGETARSYYMTDIAPTVAALLHIQIPSGSIGHPILPIINSAKH